MEGDGEDDDQHAADQHGRRNVVSWRAVEGLDQVGGGHRGDRKADAQDPGDQAALHGGHLVGQDRGLGGEEGVEEDLCDAPADEHDPDGRGEGDGQGSDRAADQADDHPRASHAQGEVVRSLNRPKSGVAHDGEQGADPGDEGEVLGGVVDADQVVDLQGQRHQQGAQEEQ